MEGVSTRYKAAAAIVVAAALIVPRLTSDAPSSADVQLDSLGVPEFDTDELDDGAGHFVVRFETPDGDETTESGPVSRRLALDENGDPIIVTTGADATVVESASTNGGLADVEDISEVTSLGGDLYAITTTLTLQEVADIPGVGVVTDDVAMGVLATSRAEAQAQAAGSYEVLQWPLENTGQKFTGPAGVVDADIDAPLAWPHSTGEGVTVAVIDTGVDADHPDIAANLWVNAGEDCTNGIDDDTNGFVDDCHGWDFVNEDASIDDTSTSAKHDHGTHIAGVIAAPRDSVGVTGVAPDAELMILKVIEHQAFWMSDAVRAIDYAVANGADVINISWGTTPSTAQADVAALQGAVDRAEAAGIVIVAAAGNQAVDIDTKQVQPASLPNPGLITVSATTNRDEKASFSAFGPATVDQS